MFVLIWKNREFQLKLAKARNKRWARVELNKINIPNYHSLHLHLFILISIRPFYIFVLVILPFFYILAPKNGETNFYHKNKRNYKKEFACNLCSYQTRRWHDLKRHSKSQHGLHHEKRQKNKTVTVEAKDRFTCGECDYTADGVRDLMRHTAIAHTVVKYSCSKCNFVTTTSALLDKHLRNMIELMVDKHEIDSCIGIIVK